MDFVEGFERALGSELLELESEVEFFNTEVIPATQHGAAMKVCTEALELSSEVLEGNDTLGEEADVLITLIGEVALAGRSMSEVISAAREKMRVNIHERTWELQPDGTWQHVRKDAA